MKKILTVVAIVSCMTIMEANAFDWSSVVNFLSKASEPQTEQTALATISDVEKQMAAIDNSAQTAFVDIVSKLSSWRETRNIKSQLKSSSTNISDVMSNYINEYFNSNKETITNKIKKMSAKDKTALVNNINTLVESGQKYMTLAANGAKTAANAFKTAQTINEAATTAANVNRVAAELRKRATTAINFANNVKSLAKTAGVSVN